MTINSRGAENRRWQWRAKYPNEYYWLVDHYSKSKLARQIYNHLVSYGELTPELLKRVREEIK